MSLYYVQKLIYNLNRDPELVKRFKNDIENVLNDYELTKEESEAIRTPNIGLL